MRNRIFSATLACFFAGAASLNAARAGTGTCVLKNSNATQASMTLSGTYGLTGQGVITATNPLQIPVGNFTHEGTVTLSGGILSSNAYIANVSMSLTETNAGNTTVNRTYFGNITVNASTCTGAVVLFNYGTTGFVMTFVNGGDGFRMSSVVPGVFITYATAQKE